MHDVAAVAVVKVGNGKDGEEEKDCGEDEDDGVEDNEDEDVDNDESEDVDKEVLFFLEGGCSFSSSVLASLSSTFLLFAMLFCPDIRPLDKAREVADKEVVEEGVAAILTLTN